MKQEQPEAKPNDAAIPTAFAQWLKDNGLIDEFGFVGHVDERESFAGGYCYGYAAARQKQPAADPVRGEGDVCETCGHYNGDHVRVTGRAFGNIDGGFRCGAFGCICQDFNPAPKDAVGQPQIYCSECGDLVINMLDCDDDDDQYDESDFECEWCGQTGCWCEEAERCKCKAWRVSATGTMVKVADCVC